ncbi:MAG: permease [Pseudopedobacter saltans]|uniref:Probable membrane transporter protein n=1 Tax=Pseudopedobacter saltans TaxID=151895 RepID=A0A2W5F368_9SPHI|nr:MAG: permease [Pseudopedobacter saltans]
MTILVFSLIVLFGAVAAGFIGSLTGLGGGAVIIPLLTVLLGVDIHYAIGTALVSVIATSSGSAAAYVKEGISNIRLGMFLEIATTVGAVLGTVVAAFVPTNVVAVVFGLVLIFNGVNSFLKKEVNSNIESSRLAIWLKLPGTYPTSNGITKYGIVNVVGGFVMMVVAGVLSGLLGIGSGAFKVIAMDNIMKVPFKVSTTTSNFMMGVTATASAVVYLQRGYIEPGLCMPVVIGVLLGAMLGAKILVKSNVKNLRVFFAIVIMLLALNMIYKGLYH